jgi:hypothetical protein
MPLDLLQERITPSPLALPQSRTLALAWVWGRDRIRFCHLGEEGRLPLVTKVNDQKPSTIRSQIIRHRGPIESPERHPSLTVPDLQ